MIKFERDMSRYEVQKVKDLCLVLPMFTNEELDAYSRVSAAANMVTRLRKGRNPEYVVVESDNPIYETVWLMLEEQVRREKYQPMAPYFRHFLALENQELHA